MHPVELAGRRVTVMGLGHSGGGLAAARFALEQGACVTVTDERTERQLHDAVSQLRRFHGDLHLVLGGHPRAAFDACEVLIVSPAVRPGHPDVERCRNEGVRITSEIELFLQRQPARLIAVTGSNGKSTVTKLIGQLVEASCPEGSRVWVGGNIGRSLLPVVDRMRADDVAVVELSSFQLHQLADSGFRPDVAVVTGFSFNHLDWHPDGNHYRRSKEVISVHQTSEDTLVLPSELTDWPGKGRRVWFGLRDEGEDGVFLQDGVLLCRCGDREDALRVALSPALRPRHQQRNVVAAVAAARLGQTVPRTNGDDRMAAVLNRFRGLPHRFQLVCQARGRSFVNDSCATTPESCQAALDALPRSCVLIAGGGDKGVPLTTLCRRIADRARAFVATGRTGRKMADLVRRLRGSEAIPVVEYCSAFEDAFRRAVALSRPGDIVLLSPACSSHDQFTDYRERGDVFTRLAKDWCAESDTNR